MRETKLSPTSEGPEVHGSAPVRFTGRRIRREGKHRVVCAEWDLLSGLCLPAAPAELPGTGKALGPVSFGLLLGRARRNLINPD